MAEIDSQLLALADPIVLHVIGLGIVLLLQNTVRLRKPLALSLVCACTLAALIFSVGFVRTSSDPNYFKLLKLRNTRYPTPQTVLTQVDRLEEMGILDQYAIEEVEQKLAGNTSSYFWKSSHDPSHPLRS